MRACSACGGDYEDPDRTAWPAGADRVDCSDDELSGWFEEPETGDDEEEGGPCGE